MPPKNRKQNKRFLIKRRRFPRGITASNSTSITRTSPFSLLTIVPAKLIKSLRYADIYSFTTGTAGIFGTQQTIRLNSIFDPDLTGTGHQPYGHDTLATLFGNYRVISVKFDLMFTTPGSAADILCCCSYGISTTADLTGINPATPLEWPNAIAGQLSSSGSRNRTLKGNIHLNTLLGVSKDNLESDPNNQAVMGANPTNTPRLNFSIASYSGTGAQAASCRLVIDFTTMFFNRLNLALS